MIQLARFCMRHPGGVIAAWLIVLVASQGAFIAIGEDYRNNFSLPDTDSERTFELLGASFPDLAGAEAQIVFHTPEGQVTDPDVRARVTSMIAEATEIPHVSDIESPYREARTQTISDDGTIAFAAVKFNQDLGDLERRSTERLIETAESIESPDLQVELGGQPISLVVSPPGPGSSTGIALAAAAIVLLVSFGSALAMGLPIATALVGLGTTLAAIGLGSHVLDFAVFSPELASMIGLGVGVDYALFILSRFREIYRERGGHRLEGAEQAAIKELAIEQSMDRAGRAVIFAGVTVVISLMGMFALGFEFMNGLAVAMSVGVLVMLAASLTVLPALLHLFGARVGKLGRRRRRLEQEGIERPGTMERLVTLVQRHSVITALLSAVILFALAIPALGIRLGSSDAGNDDESLTIRKAYDLLEEGFGPGFNGPLQLALALPEVDEPFAANQLAKALRQTPGIESVERPRLSPGRDVASVIAYPTTSPQSAETTELVRLVRREVVPTVEANTGARVFVGGQAAREIDFTKLIAEKLFFFIGIVVLLSALLLLVVFRSLVIPVQAAVMNLMSIGASLGIVALAFQEGLMPGIQPGPIESFLPVMVFAIVFGLSMDYEVFLVSRIHEEWLHRRDSSAAIREGLARTGRVVTAAAAVMIVVFSSFIVVGDRIPAQFGLGLAAAVFLDAFVIRVMLLPAVLEMIGSTTWRFPAWLDRLLPSLHVEPHEDAPPREPWGLAIRLFWATVLALLIAGATVWIVLADEEDDPKAEKVLAERGTVVSEFSAPGSVVDPGELAVNFPGGGAGQRIRSVKVEMGDRVEKGDVLAVVESAQARGQVRAARANLAAARTSSRTGGASRRQSDSSVAAAQRSLRSSREVARASDRGADKALRSAKEAERRARKSESRARTDKRAACGGPSTPEQAALCDAARAQLEAAEEATAQAAASVRQAKNQRRVGDAQQDQAIQAARNGVSSARRAEDVTRAQSSGTLPPIEAARAQVRQARRGLNRTKLRAPAAGTIVSVAGRKSEYVGATAAASALGAPAGGGSGAGGSGADGAGPSAAQAGRGQGGAAQGGDAAGQEGAGSDGAASGQGSGAAASGVPAPSGFVILTDVDRLEVSTSFSEDEAAEMRPGQPATVTIPALDDEKLKGAIASISPAGSPTGEGVRFLTVISLREVRGDMKVGQSAHVEVETGRARDVVYVPVAAVRTAAGRSTAAIVKGGVPRLRRVRVGLEGRQSVEIRSGIKPGDRVLLGRPRIDEDD